MIKLKHCLLITLLIFCVSVLFSNSIYAADEGDVDGINVINPGND